MPESSKPICVKCGRVARPHRARGYVVYTVSYEPIEVWEAEEWRCPECKQSFLAGFRDFPMLTPTDPGFKVFLEFLEVTETPVFQIETKDD